MIHEANEDYYRGLNDSPYAAVQQKFLDDMQKRGLARSLAVQAVIASQNEQALVERFRSGEFRKPDGELYTAFRMTKIWKTESARLGLDAAQRDLGRFSLPGVKMPDGGLVELAGRIMDLTKRYEENLLVRRDSQWIALSFRMRSRGYLR